MHMWTTEVCYIGKRCKLKTKNDAALSH